MRPRVLVRGDCVGLCAPSGFVSHEVLDRAVQALEEFGLCVKVGESCFRQHGYLAGTDEVRAADFNRFAAADNIAGIFAVRGGYGAQRILPMLDWNAIRRGGKPFFGYSDATAIHTAIQQRCGLMSFHTPMPATELRFGLDAFSMASYESCLFGGETRELCNPLGQDIVSMSNGVCEGLLTGGNLSVLAVSLGTPYTLDARGKVLFLEEVGEAPYRVDRMLTQLALAGVFADCAGVLLGAFTGCDAPVPQASLALEQVLEARFAGIGKPVLRGVACGHVLPSLSLPLGARVRMDAGVCRVDMV